MLIAMGWATGRTSRDDDRDRMGDWVTKLCVRTRSDGRLGGQVVNRIAIGWATGRSSGDDDRVRGPSPKSCAPIRGVFVWPHAYSKLYVVAGLYEAVDVFDAGHVVMGMRHVLCDHAFGVGVAVVIANANGGGARRDSR